MKYIIISTVLILLLTISNSAQTLNYPIATDLDSEPPPCYMEQADGITIDLSQICSDGKPDNNRTPVRGFNGGMFVPIRSPRSEGCACPYDLNSVGELCGTKSFYAEGSPVCYHPAS
ncbi:MAG: hypothetical protein F6K09_12835 [Merismopedia sp. SIO2A8]|nr:hypothetical protein [Merismopedia sp. SIO2A8]